MGVPIEKNTLREEVYYIGVQIEKNTLREEVYWCSKRKKKLLYLCPIDHLP